MSLRTRLLGVLMLPFAGMLVFAALWTLERWDSLRTEEDTAERIELVTLIAEARYNLRATVLAGGAANEPRLPQAFRSLIGGRFDVNAADLAASSRGLRMREDAIEDLIGPLQWQRLDEAMREREALLVQFRRDDGDRLDRRKAFDALSARTEQVSEGLDRLQGALIEGARPGSGYESLADASVIESLLFDQTELLFTGLIFDELDRASGRELAALAVMEDALAEELSSETPASIANAYAAETRSPSGRVWRETLETMVTRALAGQPPVSPSPIELGRIGLAVQRRIFRVANIRRELGDTLIADANAAITSARKGLMLAIALTSIVAIVTLALAAALLRSLTRGVERLTGRARSIEHGELAAAPLPVTGPSDIAVLTRAFNDMSETLRGVEERASALADADSSDEDPERHLPGVIGAALDRSVARLTKATRRLRAREALALSIVETAAEGVWTVDADGVVRSANSAAVRMVGMDEDAMVGRTWDRVQPLAPVHAATASGHSMLTARELELPRPDGGTVPTLVSTRQVVDEDGRRMWTVFAFDISERRDQERRLEHEASHDALTGLANRASALSFLRSALADNGGWAGGTGLLFIDLDHFKHVNDALGHRIGDDLLVAVANRLARLVRPGDLIARLGGDEFVVIVQPAHAVDLVHDVARRVTGGFDDPFRVGEERAWISASVGVAWTPDPHVSAEDLLRDADIAMYHAKDEGRGSIAVFDDEMRRWMAERSATEQALRRALSTEGLTDRYQPIVDLATGRVIGVELLARLSLPGGEVPPGQFIAVAEDSGLIVDVGRWALRSACRRIAEWERAGHDAIRVSVNISSLHLASGELIDDVREAASVLDGGLHRLGIEITESSLVRDETGARRTLGELRRMGIAISLDDFGTGYSSLAYLRDLPIDVVKIDRSFVSAMESSEMDSAIVTGIATLARARRLTVVAEGVETVGQAEQVLAAGCQQAQGFLYSRPVPFGELERWIMRRRATPGTAPSREDERS